MLKLREGGEFLFRIEKLAVAPDSTTQFILSGPDRRKFLLPADVYSHYGLRPGMRIKCRIDRLNCNGEIFLEPDNPYYSEGKSYLFRVNEISERTDKSGNTVNVFLVRDLFGNSIAVPFADNPPEPGKKVRLRVERITKGRIYLYRYPMQVNSISLRAGRYYDFTVERIEKGLNEENFYVIRDPSGSMHTLQEKYYSYYGLKPGKNFRGKVVRYPGKRGKIIEPVNPYYKPGSTMTMKVISCERNTVNSAFTIGIVDKFGYSHCIESAEPASKESVRCKVKMIKKGRPLLELL